MKKIIPYITIACLAGYTVTSSLPVIASGCNSHMNKKAETKCAEDDIDCQSVKTEKIELNKTVRS
tara:strand:+ start:158 stop:352 length:195 start_codon:yes stop_codon:yes gene_type:complete